MSVRVIIIENCNECPYCANGSQKNECLVFKGYFDDTYPSIPSWCKLDDPLKVDWEEYK